MWSRDFSKVETTDNQISTATEAESIAHLDELMSKSLQTFTQYFTSPQSNTKLINSITIVVARNGVAHIFGMCPRSENEETAK